MEVMRWDAIFGEERQKKHSVGPGLCLLGGRRWWVEKREYDWSVEEGCRRFLVEGKGDGVEFGGIVGGILGSRVNA